MINSKYINHKEKLCEKSYVDFCLSGGSAILFQGTCSVKAQIVNILNFEAHTIPVSISQVHCYSRKAAINSMLNEYGCVPIKPYYGH